MRRNYQAFKLTSGALWAFVSAVALVGGCVGQVEGGSSGTSGPGNGVGNGAGASPGSVTGTGNNTTGSGAGSSSAGASSATAGSGSGVAALPVTPPYTRLTIPEYQATIKAAFGIDATVSGIPDDGRAGPFTSNVDVSPDSAGPFMLAGEDLAAQIVPAKIPACAAAKASTCIPATLQPPIEALYRRSLSAAEITAFSNMLSTLEAAGVASQDATRQLVST